MTKVRDSVIPINGQGCSILVICISSKFGDEASKQRVGYHIPIVALTTSASVLDVMPLGLPCVAYWPVATAYDSMEWYKIYRNHHLDIVIRNEQNIFRFDMNMVIRVIHK